MYPKIRMRRSRRTETLRQLAAETTLDRQDVILPLFIVSGTNRTEPVESMPGVVRESVDVLTRRAAGLKSSAVLLFGVPDDPEKDDTGASALRDDGIVPQAVRALKSERPDLAVITDVCLCGYTTHGHCGVLTESGEVDNDPSAALLGKMAAAHAAAGADVAAPSAMMDGQVAVIRETLDNAGFGQTCVMAYASKFASAFYGPFRDAAHSAPGFGDRRGYQLTPGNRREAVREAILDEEEGADWLMVKPAMPYLDIVSDLRAVSRLPLAAYHVSGEYTMLKLAAQAGVISEREAVLEAMTCIRRAGADAIITYYAEEICQWLG